MSRPDPAADPRGLSAREAAAVIVANCPPLAPERRPLKAALGLVLATDVESSIDVPPWDNAAVDGFALRAADLGPRHAPLEVIEEVAAGEFPQRSVDPGTAIRVATGAPVPQGADTVVRQEDTDARANRVCVRVQAPTGDHVRRRGSDCRRGDLVLTAGTTLSPAALGVLASIAHATPLVRPSPQVAFFGGGDEVVGLDRADDILAGRKIASANSYSLFGLIQDAGGIPVDLGLALDTRASVGQHFERAKGTDLLVTTAGVSVGARDLLRPVFTELGGEVKVSRLRVRPGAPLCFGVLGDRPWIGLPGNPVSTMVTFELFVRPAIRRLLGHPRPFRRTVLARVQESIALDPRLQHFLRAIVSEEPTGGRVARLTGPQGSGILTSMARANALLIVPENHPQVERGTVLQAVLLDDSEHVAEPPF